MTEETNNVIYFAYGSNMSTRRLQDRISGAIPIGRGKLTEYSFVCNKKSRDGSGKGNIHLEEGGIVWGVLFDIPRTSWTELDRIEGGYDRLTVQIKTEDKTVEAVTYLSNNITEERPFGSYMAHIIAGALEHSLPNEYVQMIAAIPTKPEQNT